MIQEHEDVDMGIQDQLRYIRQTLRQIDICRLDENTLKRSISSAFGRNASYIKSRVPDLLSGDNVGETVVRCYEKLLCKDDLFDHRMMNLGILISQIENLGLSERQSTVLDAGCGTGIDITFLSRFYQGSDMSFYGFDRSEPMITYAKKRKKSFRIDNVDFYKGDLFKPKKRERELADLCYIFNTDVGIKNEHALLDALSYRVKPGGYILQAATMHERISAENRKKLSGKLRLAAQKVLTQVEFEVSNIFFLPEVITVDYGYELYQKI